MCGRFVAANTPDQIAAYFGAEPPEVALPANYNVAPTNDVYCVVAGPNGADAPPRLDAFQWGLVPAWAKERKIGSKMINARSETLAEKPAFKNAFRKYRCIIPMDGFYEWKTTPAGDPAGHGGKPIKQPMFIHRLDDEPLAVAGLWSAWRDRESGPDAPWLHSCAVITTEANETMAPVHNRMPVLLPASEWERWLDPTNQDLESFVPLFFPAPNNLLTMYAVSTDVNKVSNKGPQLLLPAGDRTTAGQVGNSHDSEGRLFG